MSDNKNINEEYQYVEEGDIEPTPSESSETSDSKKPSLNNDYSDKLNSLLGQPNIRRNAIIAVLGLFALLLLIKCAGPSGKEKNVADTSNLSYQEQMKNAERPIKTNTSSTSTAPQISDSQLNEVLSNQNNLKNTISQLNDQVVQLNSQLAAVSNNYQSLQQDFLTLQNKLNVTVQAVEELVVSQKSRPVIVAHKPRTYPKATPIHYPTYFVQAIIPGRAWLINSNGETLTVLVGSKVPGYGSVTKIRPQEGRVLTSSGKILKFNQEF